MSIPARKRFGKSSSRVQFRRSAAHSDEELSAVRDELRDRYGELPTEVENLMAVASFRARARQLRLTDVGVQGKFVRFSPLPLRDSQTVRLQRLYPGSIVKAATDTVLVPAPVTARVGGQPLRNQELLDWCRAVLDGLDVPVPATSVPG